MAVNRLEKVECCGCNACQDICPVNAISFKTDIEGFWYPTINNDCINCNLCERVCPAINIKSLKHNDFPAPKYSIAAISKNIVVRWNSTSGGLFSVLAEEMYRRGGFVSGAIYNENFTVRNFISNDQKDLEQLRSSKYLQSYASGLYKTIKNLLKEGKQVLACGTPCQMAALRQFLGKDYENLIIVDFICRGVNSPKVYRSYLDLLEKEYDSKIVKIKAKNKELGWRSLTRKVTFANGKAYYGYLMDDDFRRGYHTNVYCRPCCYSCKYKGFPRMADITLGDFWGIEKYNENLDNNIGTSLVMLNSRKGEKYFEQVKNYIEFQYLPLESAFKGNIALFESLELPKIDRTSFFEDLDKFGFKYVVTKYFPKVTVKQKTFTFRNKIGALRRNFRRMHYDFKSIYTFFKINFRKNTSSSLCNDNVLIPMPGSVFDIDKTAKINIESPFMFGNNPVKNFVLPSCLRMGRNTTLNIHGGPIDRYNNKIYNLRYGAYIEIVNGGVLTIGQGATNVGLTIMCALSVTIGNGVRIGRNVSIRDWNGPHVIITDGYKNHAPVYIADHVWLCSGCTVMPGVTIGEGAVVASNALVTKDVPPKAMVAGIPAKVIKENVEWY